MTRSAPETVAVAATTVTRWPSSRICAPGSGSTPVSAAATAPLLAIAPLYRSDYGLGVRACLSSPTESYLLCGLAAVHGRGGATRLKLYLSLLWLARNFSRERPVFAYPAQQLAALLGLPSPDAAGARRVQEALRWLAEAGFVALDRRPGDVTRVHLLDDAGSGDPYRPAGPLTTPAPKRSQKEREQHFYVQLDARYWTEGWITELSGAATAMLLACLYEQRGRPDEAIWVSPAAGRERYDLSDETRNKGLRELVDWGLLDLRRRPVPAASFFDERFRARNVYVVRHGGWARKPEAGTVSAGGLGFRQPDST